MQYVYLTPVAIRWRVGPIFPKSGRAGKGGKEGGRDSEIGLRWNLIRDGQFDGGPLLFRIIPIDIQLGLPAPRKSENFGHCTRSLCSGFTNSFYFKEAA